MREDKLVEAIIDNALKYHSEDSQYPPSLVIDKQDYSDYDIEEVTRLLKQNGFKLIDGSLAPAPFSEMDEDFKKLKWYIYQEK